MKPRRGALNERRFGWGADAGDLNNDGWVDIVQANGMVDDSLDHRYTEGRKDYWYVNQKLMQSGLKFIPTRICGVIFEGASPTRTKHVAPT